MPAAVPQAPVLGPGLDAVAETSTSRRLNFELEEGKKGLNAVNVKVDGPLASQPEPDGGPRVVIQGEAKGIIDSNNEPGGPCKGPRKGHRALAWWYYYYFQKEIAQLPPFYPTC